MQSPLQLLRGERYEIEPSYQGDGQLTGPVGGPPPQADPSYAQLLAESRGAQAVPMEQTGSGAYAMAPQATPVANQGPPMQQQAGPGQPDWMTPERKRMYEKAKRAAQNYRMAVDARRQKRKQSREYSSMYHQMQKELEKAEQVETMFQRYPDLFRQDDPRTPALRRQQLEHFDQAERLKNDLRARLKKYGVKVDPKGDLPEDPFGDAGDDQFDQFIMRGYNDALMSDPYGQ